MSLTSAPQVPEGSVNIATGDPSDGFLRYEYIQYTTSTFHYSVKLYY